MATINEIKQQAEAVKNATQVGENTAMRVGGALSGLADIAEQQDSKLSGLSERQQFVDNCLRQIYVTDADFESYTPISDGTLTESGRGVLKSDGSYLFYGDYEDNKPRCYKFKDDSPIDVMGSNRYTSFLLKANPGDLDGDFVNAIVWNNNKTIVWKAKLSKGYWQISLPHGYEIEISGNVVNNGKNAPKYKTGFFNESEKVQKSYIDSKDADILNRQQFVDNCLRQIYVTDADFESYTPISDGTLTESGRGVLKSDGSYLFYGDYEDNKPRCYKFKDDSPIDVMGSNRYTSFLLKANPGDLDGDFVNAIVWNNNKTIVWKAKLSKGYWQISLPHGYEIEISGNVVNNGKNAPKYKTGFFNESEKVQKSYIDSKDADILNRQQFVDNCLRQIYITESDFNNYEKIIDKLDVYHLGVPKLSNMGYDYDLEEPWEGFKPRTYKFKDTSPNGNRYTSFLIPADPTGLNGDFCNARVWDANGNFIWNAKLAKGTWEISLPLGYEIEIYQNIGKTEAFFVRMKKDFFNESERGNVENNLNPWAGKCIAFYGDSVTYIGQGTGTSNGHASAPYVADWGTNWQLYIAKYLGLKEFYSRGVGSAMYEYQDWVQYAHTETGYSGDRPYPFVNFDSAEEKEGFTKTHGYLAAWDRIKAQFPASIKDSIDAIFITDSNSAVNHTSDDFQTPAFIKGATKDADWAADSVYNVFGGDYDITTFAGAICSMIMKLQAWMPNVQIIIGSQISGRGDDSISGAVRGENFTKLDEARRGMYCAEKTRKIAGMMSIPYVPVFESMSVNPLNRNGKIYDIVHPYTKAGGYRVGKTIAQYLMNFTPSEPPV